MDLAFYTVEIFLTEKYIEPKQWRALFLALSDLVYPLASWRVVVVIRSCQIRYFLQTTHPLSATLSGLSAFLFNPAVLPVAPEARSNLRPIFYRPRNLIDFVDYTRVHNYGQLVRVEIDFRKLNARNFVAKSSFYFMKDRVCRLHQSLACAPGELLSVDFAADKNYAYKSPPKYSETHKVLEFLHHDANMALLAIDTFPYSGETHYLKLSDYDFDKHSLVLGASGSGKSKFLSSFICNLFRDPELREKYKVVAIDPHAAMQQDLKNVAKVIDFDTSASSIDLFSGGGGNLVASTELLLDLFKILLADQYNSKLERVLRHAIYLLSAGDQLNFLNLRSLLTDISYRNIMVKKLTPELPFSIVNFFLADFNELKSKAYAEAFAPIISFIDEMEMVPVFNSAEVLSSLEAVVQENFLTIFSLDRIKLGTKVTQTIAGLVMEQMFNWVEKRTGGEHIIFIVDEVAVVENPILVRLLSEARKYNLSLILVGQYFNQFSSALQYATFANVIDYYIFRLSRLEAGLLADNLNLKIPADDTKECKIKLLTELNNRECVVRASIRDRLFPAFKATTTDFVVPEGMFHG